MKVNIVFKSGKEVTIDAKKVDCTRNGYGQLINISIDMEKGKIFYIDLGKVDMIYEN